MGVVVEPFVALVVVLVNYGVRVLGVDLSIVGIEFFAGVSGSCRAHDHDFRMRCLDGLVHNVEALPELFSAVFVADAQVLEIERLRVAHTGPECAPLGVGAAVAELNQVKGILDEYVVEALPVALGFQRSDVAVAGELAGYAVVEHRKRGCAQ